MGTSSSLPTKVLLRTSVETHLPRPQLPVRRQAVSRVHEDFGDAETLLDGLQFEPQQVVVNPVSIKSLSSIRGNNV